MPKASQQFIQTLEKAVSSKASLSFQLVTKDATRHLLFMKDGELIGAICKDAAGERAIEQLDTGGIASWKAGKFVEYEKAKVAEPIIALEILRDKFADFSLQQMANASNNEPSEQQTKEFKSPSISPNDAALLANHAATDNPPTDVPSIDSTSIDSDTDQVVEKISKPAPKITDLIHEPLSADQMIDVEDNLNLEFGNPQGALLLERILCHIPKSDIFYDEFIEAAQKEIQDRQLIDAIQEILQPDAK